MNLVINQHREEGVPLGLFVKRALSRISLQAGKNGNVLRRSDS